MSAHPYNRVQPWWMGQDQPYAEGHLVSSQADALLRLGEPVLFTLLWSPADYEAGLVEKCSVCMTDLLSRGYKSAGNPKCPGCYGTTFEGGWRAQIVRPAIVSDRNTDTTEGQRGVSTTDRVSIETTGDFFARAGDFMFRRDDTRYQLGQMDTVTIRTGFQSPDQHQVIGGRIDSASLEARTARAYAVQPDGEPLRDMLDQASTNAHLVDGLTRHDIVRGPLVPPRL